MTVNQSLFIVGIGASAGGLDAIRTFISKLEPAKNMAYIIAQHMSPEPPPLYISKTTQSIY